MKRLPCCIWNQQYEKGKMNKKQLLAYKVALDDAYDQKKAEQVKKELLSRNHRKIELKKEFWPLFETVLVRLELPILI